MSANSSNKAEASSSSMFPITRRQAIFAGCVAASGVAAYVLYQRYGDYLLPAETSKKKGGRDPSRPKGRSGSALRQGSNGRSRPSSPAPWMPPRPLPTPNRESSAGDPSRMLSQPDSGAPSSSAEIGSPDVTSMSPDPELTPLQSHTGVNGSLASSPEESPPVQETPEASQILTTQFIFHN